jgi:hypothetical protein
MTLIIGCINKNYGIIAGDTQLSRTGLSRNGKLDKSIEIKTNNYGSDFLMGILGKWVSWRNNDDNPSYYTNEYDNLITGLQTWKEKDKKSIVENFLDKREYLDATAIYIKRNENDFELGMKSSKPNDVIKNFSFDKCKLYFNEPFSDINDTYVLTIIENFTKEYKLVSKLEDSLFLLNNTILTLISEGDSLSIKRKNEDIVCLDVDNTVGGYVTIQLLTKNIHFINNFSFNYNKDYNCLTDGLTYSFAKKLNFKRYIRYVDNLAMIVKSSNYPSNSNIKDNLIDLAQMQIKHIMNKDILKPLILNQIIDYCNEKYNLNLTRIETIVTEENDLDFVFDEVDEIDPNYILNFFI